LSETQLYGQAKHTTIQHYMCLIKYFTREIYCI
jgi:hypothetical protein